MPAVLVATVGTEVQFPIWMPCATTYSFSPAKKFEIKLYKGKGRIAGAV